MTKREVLPRGFFLNGERSSSGMRISFGAVVSVAEFSSEEVLILTHSGRIRVLGSGLLLSVFEGRGIEIVGKVRGLEFLYGKD